MVLACAPDGGEMARLLRDGGAPSNPYGEPLPPAERAYLLQAMEDPERESAALELLVEATMRADPAAVRGADVLRDPEVVAALVERASREGPLREVAARHLLRHTPRAMLRKVAGLRPSLRSAIGLRLAAKGGVEGEGSPGEGPERDSYLASRGDRAVMDRLLLALQRAPDPTAEAEAVERLGWAATDEALRALARHLHTPSIRPWRGGRRSVRLDILEALNVHWPEEPAFFWSRVRSDKDYRRAARQVERFLGVRPEGELPPFFTFEPGQ